MTTQYDRDVRDMKAIGGKEIAGFYDLKLLSDMETDDDTEHAKNWYPCFAVGEESDLAAGIRGGAVSPWFRNESEAYGWCFDNRAFLDSMYGNDE